jgi:putative protease
MNRSDFEIMAPAGSREALASALGAGADSVYFGAGALNMRAGSASPFTAADLPEIAQRCGDAGAKSYLALNTVIYERDRGEMLSLLDAAAGAGVSAVIAADPAAMTAARERGLSVHLSTQLNIANADSLAFYARWADTAVLARELDLGQVAEISALIKERNICGPSGRPVRIEMFCHGALCMAVSGRCALSLHTGGKSANRGECLQVCRRRYRAVDDVRGKELEVDNGYIFSPKDLCTVGIVGRMIAAGVSVFKIEGRARSPEYVKTTVECYGEAVRAVAEGRFTPELAAKLKERLARVFNRGFWEGWYLGAETMERAKEAGSAATRKKLYAGRCVNWYAKAKAGEFEMHGETVRPGDELLVIGPTTGVVEFTPDEIRVEGKKAGCARKGESATMPVAEKIRPGDLLYVLRAAERR